MPVVFGCSSVRETSDPSCNSCEDSDSCSTRRGKCHLPSAGAAVWHLLEDTFASILRLSAQQLPVLLHTLLTQWNATVHVRASGGTCKGLVVGNICLSEYMFNVLHLCRSLLHALERSGSTEWIAPLL
jgi:hypothetical protein